MHFVYNIKPLPVPIFHLSKFHTDKNVVFFLLHCLCQKQTPKINKQTKTVFLVIIFLHSNVVQNILRIELNQIVKTGS